MLRRDPPPLRWILPRLPLLLVELALLGNEQEEDDDLVPRMMMQPREDLETNTKSSRGCEILGGARPCLLFLVLGSPLVDGRLESCWGCGTLSLPGRSLRSSLDEKLENGPVCLEDPAHTLLLLLAFFLHHRSDRVEQNEATNQRTHTPCSTDNRSTIQGTFPGPE